MAEWVNKVQNTVETIIKDELEKLGFDPDKPPKMEVISSDDTDRYFAISGKERVLICIVFPPMWYADDDSMYNGVRLVQDIKIPARGSNGPTDHAAPVK